MKGHTLLLFIFVAMFGLSTCLKGYDAQIATELAHASQAAYCGEKALGGLTCGENCKNLKGYEMLNFLEHQVMFKHTVSSTTFANHAAKRIVVAYRGTNTAIQLLKEFVHSKAVKCNFCSSPGAMVSQYFHYFWDTAFQEKFLPQMKALVKKYPTYDFYITGHSLGGAFATLAALDLSDELGFPIDKIYLYTFGSPRVGNQIFAKEVMSKVKQSWRIVNANDIVPHIPPIKADGKLGDLFYGWHINTEVWYPNGSTSYKMCATEEDKTCSNSLSVTSYRVSDHLVYMGARSACVNPVAFVFPNLSELTSLFKWT